MFVHSKSKVQTFMFSAMSCAT